MNLKIAAAVFFLIGMALTLKVGAKTVEVFADSKLKKRADDEARRAAANPPA
jgi:hypothetical protein